MKKTFYSNGKLLLTGEYVVLDGATALAIPTKYGQSLSISSSEKKHHHWKSIDKDGNTWFSCSFSYSKGEIKIESETDIKIATTLSEILTEAKKLNTSFLAEKNTFEIVSKLDFERNWGLGSSSTLINNIAQWANVDAFTLLKNSFGGSGYDIAAAQYDSPIFYTKTQPPTVREIKLSWDFTDQLFFVHLNKKQDSKEGIKIYRKASVDNITIQKISDLTNKLLVCYDIDAFQQIMDAHEKAISEIIKQPTVKENYFSDYPNTIKSLGAWGGDFILAIGDTSDQEYFKKKGYPTIIPFTDLVK